MATLTRWSKGELRAHPRGATRVQVSHRHVHEMRFNCFSHQYFSNSTVLGKDCRGCPQTSNSFFFLISFNFCSHILHVVPCDNMHCMLCSCPSVCMGSAHWSPISLVPHLIGPLLIGPPTHWSPNTLLELIGPPSHWSPISLVPHLIGPPFHSSPHHRPIPMVPHLIGPPSHWFPISLVPQLISLPSHWSPNWHPCITHSIGPPSHWSPRLIGPPSHWSLNSLVPFSLVPQFRPIPMVPISLVPYPIGPPIGTHTPPIPLVPNLIGPPSHWSLLTGWAPNS